MFILPAILGLFVFMWGPILASLGLSFTKWNLITSPEWRGFQNYIELFQDPLFLKVMKNTFYFVVMYAPILIISSLFIAIGLNQKIKFKDGFRIMYFLPVVTSVAAVSVIWRWVFNSRSGLLNVLLGYVGIQGPAWIEDPNIALFSVALMSVWWTLGTNILIFLAGLQDIPRVYYEAAEIDGASGWKKMRYITLPLLTPTTFLVVVLAMIQGFKVFGQVYIMTGGGPVNSTNVILLYMYRKAFENLEVGLGSAVACIFFIIVTFFTFIQFKVSGAWVKYR